jgi:hypothetical protein
MANMSRYEVEIQANIHRLLKQKLENLGGTQVQLDQHSQVDIKIRHYFKNEEVPMLVPQ